MLEDPGLDPDTIASCFEANYDLKAASISFLPLGYDPYAVVNRVVSIDGAAWFLKVRFGPMHEPSLQIPRALVAAGVSHILAAIPTRSAALWCALDDFSAVLYPFIEGDNATERGLTDDQCREFGATLRAVHTSGLAERFRGQLPLETFALPSAALVREVQATIVATRCEGDAAGRLAAFWRENQHRIDRMLARSEELGTQLQAKSFDMVPCHADIHAANILVGDDGQIHLIDWDGPLIAPRDRDLLFVVGSRIARAVTPREEALFFAGYGPVAIDPAALIYYRYERVIEDRGEWGKSVFLNAGLSEETRGEEAAMAMSIFAPDNILASVETVTLPCAERESPPSS